MEQWKDIPGYEGIYQASNEGQIRSTPGKVTSNARYPLRMWKSRILKQKGKGSGRGDRRVSLWKNGKEKTHLVARLVASAWCDGYIEGYTVNHIDGNYRNNSSKNLEWVPLAENIKHGFASGLYRSVQKPVVILSEKGEYLHFNSMSEASRYLGRNHGYIHEAIKKSHKITSSSGERYKVVYDRSFPN